jgi:hypothetical protein
MKIIKVQVSKIKPNPFKRFISNGKLNEDIIQKLIEGYKQTQFHENLCARENEGGEIELVYGHHRLEAVKRVYGKTHKIYLRVYSMKEFPDESMLVDMVRENVTQRDADFQDKKEAIVLTYNWLQTKSNGVKQFDTKMQERDSSGKFKPTEDSYRAVARFLSKQGKAISYETVRQYLRMEFNLDKKILEKVEKLQSQRGKEEKVTVWQGETLSQFKDKKEQRDLLKAIKKSSEQRRDRVNRAITVYKESPIEVKEKIRKGEIDIKDVSVENFKVELRKKAEEIKQDPKQLKIIELKRLIRQGENLIGKTNVEMIKTCAFFEGLMRTNVLFQLDWNTIYDMLEVAEKRGNQYVKYINKIQNKM